MNPIEDYTMEQLFEMIPIGELNRIYISPLSSTGYTCNLYSYGDKHSVSHSSSGNSLKESLYNLVKAVRGE